MPVAKLPSHLPFPSSVHRLPNELLSYVFLATRHERHCLNEFDYDKPVPRHHSGLINGPLDLSHVCRRWRMLALATSRLWTFLVLTFPITRSDLARFVHFLSRSKDSPLDIFLDFRDEEWDLDDDDEEEEHDFREEHMKRVLRIITPHISRWRTIEMLTDTWEPMYCFLRDIKGAPDLQKLLSVRLTRCNAYFVRKGEWFYPQSKKEALPLFAGMALPQLKTLSLAGVHVDWETLSTQVNSLEELELKYHSEEVMPSLSEFRSLMTSLSNLRLLTIQGWGPRLDQGTWIKQQRSICLPKVTHFTFGYVDTEYAMEFLSLFVLPALQHLGLEDLEGPLGCRGSLESTVVLDYVGSRHRSVCPAPNHTPRCCARACFPLSTLNTLSFKSIRARPPGISSLLGECQALKRIVLKDVEITTFLETLQTSLTDLKASDYTLKHPPEASAAQKRCSCQILLERSWVVPAPVTTSSVVPVVAKEEEPAPVTLKATKRRALTPRN
ncbi:hypothetical protein BDV98DRAFT_503666 [Pterulicium gracile]|uniref:Uncharacterized protein n=1 Tax=Pterulicium gracile TaxID=1884261 RepID=A0A5C3QN98_9AGAR|nr:hypothetical protein BDV98DRAFT_503666 [Pterula gracilis]